MINLTGVTNKRVWPGSIRLQPGPRHDIEICVSIKDPSILVLAIGAVGADSFLTDDNPQEIDAALISLRASKALEIADYIYQLLDEDAIASPRELIARGTALIDRALDMK